MKVYAQGKDEVEKQYKAGMKSLSTFKKYKIGYAYTSEFLQSHYHLKDIALKELSLPFITDYETFLRTDKHLKINSAMAFVRILRAMIFRAIDNEWLVKDPFRRYEYKCEETTREILTKEEIHLLMETPISRKKTGTEANIKLLDYPKQIMEKYRGLCEDGRIFPVPPYINCMDSLKRLGKKCGISKRLTWHMSRHTFATSICLSNGVPIETVSSILGHKDIKTTQIYAKITKEKLNKDMDKLSLQLNHIEEYMGHVNGCVDKDNNDSKPDRV